MDDETDQNSSPPVGDPEMGSEGEALREPMADPVAFGADAVEAKSAEREFAETTAPDSLPSTNPEPARATTSEAPVEFDPVAEDQYWSETYNAHPYSYGLDYKAFQPACRYGWESFFQHPGRTFDEVEEQLKAGWGQYRGASETDWTRARAAARAAWNRMARWSPTRPT